MNDKAKLELVAYLDNGPKVRELFVLHAIGLYAQFMLKDEAQVRECMKGGGISADAWIRAARDYRAEMSNPDYKAELRLN